MSAAIPTAPYKTPRIQPLKAAIALKNLLKNPQDTRQVALLTTALRGKSGQIQYNRFKSSPVGARILAERRQLAQTLDNHAYLATLAENSLGRRYLAFMAEENLSAQGLKEVTSDATDALKNASDEVRVFADRTRDLHDLYHVLAGYGRDEFGEICVLAFSYPQQKLRSFAVIAFFGALNFANLLRKHKIGAQGVFAAVRQAYRHGRQAAWLPGQDVEALLAEDIDLLRARLAIAPPTHYQALVSRIRASTSWSQGPIFHGKQLAA